MIESGILKSGDLLPGGRQLAQELNISRKTVLSAMEVLIFSGWLENRERVGLFVRNPKTLLPKESNKKVTNTQHQEKPKTTASPIIVINDGFPDTQLLPFKDLSSAFRQIFNQAARRHMLGYTDPLGNIKLRTTLAQGVCHERGLHATPEQMLLTRGSQQALYLVAHVLLQPGDAVVTECPGYHNAQKAFESAGLRIFHVPVDEEGIQTEKLKELLSQESNIKAIYLTPRYQYPTTVTLSAVRRRQLAEIVINHNLLVVEDDFGCHFEFSDHHIKPFSVLLPPENYIYIGTFSKILVPAIRLGFINTTQEFISKIGEYRQMVDMQGDNVMELAILDLIETGKLKRHIRKASKVYRERLEYACKLIKHELGMRVSFSRPHGGLALWIGLPFDPTERLARNGISCKIECLEEGKRYGLRIGYASMQNEDIEYVVKALKV